MSTSDENDIKSIQNDDQNDYNSINSFNEITVTSISELTHRLYAKNTSVPLDQIFRPITRESCSDPLPDVLDSNNNAIIETIKPSTPHPLIKLPKQLDVRTKVKLKRIESGDLLKNNWCHRAKTVTYNFLNHPTRIWAYIYHLIMTFMLISYLGLIMFTPRTTWEENCFLHEHRHFLKSLFERFLFVHFLLEFILRFWCSRAQKTYNKLNRIRWILEYFSRPSHLFDLLLLIAGFLSAGCYIHKIPVDFTQDVYALIGLRGFHRLFNVIQWISIQSRESPWMVLYEVFQDGGHLLFTMFNLVLLFIFLVAYGLYLAETNPDHDHSINDTKITNLLDSIYATSITLLTVGYGDISPITYSGQALTGIAIWLALALFALPGGLIGTSVALKITEQEERRKRKIRKTLAAILIQRAWRLTRRMRQFEMVQKLNQMRKNRQETLLIKTHQTLWDKIDHVIENRREFFASQFIQLLLLNKARRKFRQVVITTDPNPAMKSFWNKNRETINILEEAHGRLELTINNQRTKSEQCMLELDLLELRLLEIQHKIRVQNEILKKVLFEINHKL